MNKNTIVELYNGTYIKINPRLLDFKDAWDKLDDIKRLHYEKSIVFDLMENTDDPEELQLYAGLVQEIEFELQDAWGFDRNVTYHRFWNLPKCKCPKLDNEDMFGTKYSIYQEDCPIHGNLEEEC